MSFSFFVKTDEPPIFRSAVDALQLPDIRCSEIDDPSELADELAALKSADGAVWPDVVLHFYRPRISTRGVEIALENKTFQVRINSLAAPEDYELALRFLDVFTQAEKQPIEDEYGKRVKSGELRMEYGNEWIQRENAAGINSVVAIIDKDEHSDVTIPGVLRDFHIGPRLLKKLRGAGPESKLIGRLVRRMRLVEFVDTERWFPASIMRIQSRETKKQFNVSAWAPDTNYVFPAVEFLAISVDKGLLFVPYEKLPLLAGNRARFLDEKQMLVESFSSAEWPALVAKAREYEAFPNAPAAGKSIPNAASADAKMKKWWEVWK